MFYSFEIKNRALIPSEQVYKVSLILSSIIILCILRIVIKDKSSYIQIMIRILHDEYKYCFWMDFEYGFNEQ